MVMTMTTVMPAYLDTVVLRHDLHKPPGGRHLLCLLYPQLSSHLVDDDDGVEGSFIMPGVRMTTTMMIMMITDQSNYDDDDTGNNENHDNFDDKLGPVPEPSPQPPPPAPSS